MTQTPAQPDPQQPRADGSVPAEDDALLRQPVDEALADPDVENGADPVEGSETEAS